MTEINPDYLATAKYEAEYKAYIAECHQIDPVTKCYKCSPVCPLITVKGKSFCLLPASVCNLRELCGCDQKYPYMSYAEARRKADFWVEPESSFTVTIKEGKVK